MSNFPGVAKTLDLLNSLRTTVRDAAVREEKIVTDYRTRVTRERQLRDRALRELADQGAQERADAEAAQAANVAGAETRLTLRKERLQRAKDTVRAKLLAKVEQWEGSRKYRMQKEEMQSGRTREADLAAAEKQLKEFTERLTEEQAVLAQLEFDAKRVMGGYYGFVRLITKPPKIPEPNITPDENRLLAEAHDLLVHARADLDKIGHRILPKLSKLAPVLGILVLGAFGAVPLLKRPDYTFREAGIAAGAAVFFGLVLHFTGRSQNKPLALAITSALEKTRRLHLVCADKSTTRYSTEIERAEKAFRDTNEALNEEWGRVREEASQTRVTDRQKLDAKAKRAMTTFERQIPQWGERIHAAGEKAMAKLEASLAARKTAIEEASRQKEAVLQAENENQWRALEADWKARVPDAFAAFDQSNAAVAELFPPWSSPTWTNWTPPKSFSHAAQFGSLDVDLEKLAEQVTKDPRLAPPRSTRFEVPLLLKYPQEGSILIETKDSGRETAIAALNNIVLRLLGTAPPGRLSFTIMDSIGLGQNFSGIMHLADYGEHLIDGRIWTQAAQIEQKLADLNDHMEKVIQMYLRNEYATIAEYNEQAGNIAEKYRYLVIADFPMNFSEVAVKRLHSIVTSGARCGVYTLIHWDHRHQAPHNFVAEDFRKASICINATGGRLALAGKHLPGVTLHLDTPPDADFSTALVQKIGKVNRDSNRVEVPFSHVTPPEAQIWTEETTNELRVPIGRTGATKLQYLAVGKGTRQHGLIAGKTGSGKSTLFHVIITNLALWCSPEQVEFYLIDFKKGVEFKCYGANRLPHARVVAIESDREFGLSVLQRVDAELKRRGDLFRNLGVQDVAGYKRAGGTEPMPRSLLMIDEFQEYFVEDDRVSQGASVLLDRIVRQGRAFGIHVLLGSQTLGGAYSMARTTLGQMVIRIALQCNEADAYLIMDDTNPAPRLLSRPGEGIYNDAAGAVEGNSPFQAVWISDQERDEWLEKIRARADASGKNYPGPIVFEGDAPASVAENPLLEELLTVPALKRTTSGRIWLGAPNSIKGPTEATFHRQSGNNMLLVGQRDEAVLSIFSVGLISLAAQYPKEGARFVVFDSSPPESPQREALARVVKAIPHAVELVKNNEINDVVAALGAEFKRRSEDERGAEAPPIYVFINGIQRLGKLRYEDDFSYSSDEDESNAKPGATLNKLICEGAGLGFHFLVACDTYNNVNRSLSKKAFSEFEMRVLFQMSANDSASLIDSPKASTLGMHRALFFNEQEGYTEVFRPYAPPSNEWLEHAEKELGRLVTG